MICISHACTLGIQLKMFISHRCKQGFVNVELKKYYHPDYINKGKY